MKDRNVVILSDNPDFARRVVSRWSAERQAPNFTVLGTAMWSDTAAESCDAVIAGPVESSAWVETLRSVEQSVVPLLCAAADGRNLRAVRDALPNIAVVTASDDSVDAVVVCASEILRRIDSESRAKVVEASARQCERNAVLGRYMLEQRHGINNALTSVLGNAELLLLEPGALTAQMRDQIQTIHNMAVRIHEIVQRFSSLETELRVGEIESHGETGTQMRRMASGA